ncbi:MAG TPA: NAD(P)/FAD-dependent oxidoreductase [Solirubrobacteraceae bacterium]|nr:NAD(P)/FAD-dependent oxidoreductase [Solirubrobacteraceae bacterium]
MGAAVAQDLNVLWQPVQIGAVTVANRICVSAHQTHYPAREGEVIGDRYVAYMEARARGGAGLLVVEAGAVHESTAKVGLIDLYRETIVPGLRTLGEAVHAHGAKLFAQLSHLGSQDFGTSDLDRWHPVVAPTPLPSTVYGRVAKAIDEDEIADIVAGYGQAAAHARDAGLDGAEISAGHGYLMCQFLSPLTNRRDDRYGGSVDNRCRFAIEAAREVRRRCGRAFALGIRLSFDEFVGDAGLTPELSEDIVRTLHASGMFDYFSITGGNYHTIHEWAPNIAGGRDGHLAPHAERARAACAQEVPVMVAAAIRTIDRAAEIVSRGQADLVAMMRAHIADPDIVAKARAGRREEIRRCVGANQGCLRRAFANEGITCTVNPAAGRERTLPGAGGALAPRDVLVVGGGPAGMMLAETAARRGHRVTLLEQAERLGGQLLLAGRLPGRATWLELADDLAASLERLGVDVRLGVAADAERVVAAGPDAVYVATGSTFDASGYSISAPHRDTIPGLSGAHVLDAGAAIAAPEHCGAHVVVVDDNSDYVPLGLALLLARTGRTVELVTRHLHVGSRLTATGDLPFALPQLAAAGVRVHAQTVVVRIEPGTVTVADAWGGEEASLVANTVVLSMMRRSDAALARALAERGVAATLVGDCVAPREVDDAMYEGLRLGLAV